VKTVPVCYFRTRLKSFCKASYVVCLAPLPARLL